MDKKITLGILAYNHEQFIEECLLSAISLTYKNLEIIISDDCSSDQTFNIIKKIVEANPTHHKIIINKNENNLGIAGNFNKTFYELATGDFLVTLGGDDYISKNYFEYAMKCFDDNETLMMIDFQAFIIEDDKIRNPNPLHFQQKIFTIQDYLSIKPINSFAPGRIIRKDLIAKFLRISLKCPTEDTVLVNRALLLGSLMRVNKTVLHYRRHQHNISSRKNLKIISNISIISQYMKDSIHLYENGIIEDEILLNLLKRYRYELKKRNVTYSNLNKYIRIILLKVLKLLYRSNIKINSLRNFI